MKSIDTFNNLLLEVEILKKRINMIGQYEKNLSLEKENIDNLIKLQMDIINQIEKDIDQLTGIENKLYKEIVINGISISKAIDKVSLDENKDVSTLWKNYYPKVKQKIEQLSNMKLKEGFYETN